MVGLSPKLMLHAEGFAGNMNTSFQVQGASLYGKYRFFSQDGLHRHFRLAAFARFAASNLPYMQEAIDLEGYNTGFESGLISTWLRKKLALSATTSFVHAGKAYKNNALNFTLSGGRLLWPVKYRSYTQTNCNFMLEFPAQVLPGTGDGFVDAAPAVQLIFNSRLRLDAGYRFAMINSIQRVSQQGFLLRLEYNFFNAFN